MNMYNVFYICSFSHVFFFIIITIIIIIIIIIIIALYALLRWSLGL